MHDPDRRTLLKWAGVSSVAVLGGWPNWALSRLVPVDDPLQDYPYRVWEDLYRDEWRWDAVGYAAHCSNCAGNCAFKVFVKDGIVLREEQLAQYPRSNNRVPDFNPRGCQKGAVHSHAMYDADRLRFPLKRTGERGAGQWQRITWDQALTEIADRIIDLVSEHGPQALMATQGTGLQADLRGIAPLRFASLLGAVHKDFTSAVGDIPTGVRLPYGRSWRAGGTSDRLFDADYILLSGCNPNATRIADAHFIWEAKYNGGRVVVTAPDYNPSSIHADLWLPVKQGSDPFLMMSLVNVILAENLVDREFVREQTDLPLLVRTDNERLLRQSDLQANGRDDVFYLWDLARGEAVAAPGCTGSGNRSIALGGIEPALEGRYQVGGLTVRPAFESVCEEAARYTPQATASITGVHPQIVRQEARAFARAKTAIIVGGLAIPKYSNGLLTLWSQVLLLSLTGHGGPNGDILHIGVGWKRPRVDELAVPKPPRIEAGGTGEWFQGDYSQEARTHYREDVLRQHTGFGIAELQDMISESVENGWMPHWGEPRGMIVWGDNVFRRNKSAHRYRERVLAKVRDLYVNINTRMDSSALWADYVLPAASHYEAWETRSFGYHRFINLFTAPASPVGEAKPDWDIAVLLCAKIQERAQARGVGAIDDPAFGVSRDLHTIHEDFTIGGKLATAHDAAKWLVENSPELDGQSFEEGANRGFFVMNESAVSGDYLMSDDNLPIPFGAQVIAKQPYPTLSGRITFYIDHDWFLRLRMQVPTARRHAGHACSRYPLGLYSPHTRWGIHSNWRANKYMMRLQRGEPHIYINPALAAARGIEDGGRVRVFNDLGEFHAQAKFYPSAPPDAIMMEHAWEPYQFEDGGCLNNVTAPILQPLELVGNWGHLKFEFFDWNPNQLAHTTGIDIERA